MPIGQDPRLLVIANLRPNLSLCLPADLLRGHLDANLPLQPRRPTPNMSDRPILLSRPFILFSSSARSIGSQTVDGDAAESFRGQSVVEMELVLFYKREC